MARDSAPAQNAPLNSAAQRAPSSADKVRTTDQGMPASSFGLLADNAGFIAQLGANGWRLGAEFLTGQAVSLEGLAQPIPGVHFDSAQWQSQRLQLRGHLSIPYLDNAEFEARINAQGVAQMSGKTNKQLNLPALGNPKITLSMTESGALSGEINAQNIEFVPKSLSDQANATAEGTIRLANGLLSGEGTAQISYSDLGSGEISFNFSDTGSFSARGTLRITPPFVEEVTSTLAVDEAGNLNASASLVMGNIQPALPGLSLIGGSLQLDYLNGALSGAIEGFSAAYPGLGGITVEQATIGAQGFNGSGSLNLDIPALNEASGQVTINNGGVSGSITLGAEAFPEGLPVQQPNITATLAENGSVSVSGSAKVQLGPAGTGVLTAGYSDAEGFSLGGDVQLEIPGLNTVTAHISYAQEQISGEVQVPVNNALLPGLEGAVTVRYAQDRWSGETTLNFSADNDKLSGTVTVTVAQTDDGALELGGGGEVTAQLMPRLQGTLTASILPEGGVDVSGAIEVTEPLELFPEKKMDKELFKYSQNIPLWAMLVAVIRVRAGVRSGVGPGVFRNIRVEGSYTLGADESDPSFNVTGELYMPAFVEGYVAFGAGLGLDVVLGSLTGGIEGVGTAGLYGAISAVPELTYADGDWGIEGTATLAAGARLKLGLNAWAEIEALWVTIWDKEWNLAEVVMPVGPDLGLQAHMAYKFGQPEPPSIEMSSSGIDTDRLIQGAMPKDGPAPSGARETLKNTAEWKGALREQREAAVPAEQVAQQNKPETPPPAPPRPQKTDGAPPTGQDAAATPAAASESSQLVAEAAEPDSNIPAAVPEGSLPESDQPRHPKQITLDMLDEPSVPLPRTPSQEKQDIDAADEMVGLVIARAEDTAELDDYFPSIKQRFGLVSLGYEGDFDKGVKIVGKINPRFTHNLVALLSGTDLPSEMKEYVTKTEFKSRRLHGVEVGSLMVAAPLGPDHIRGSDTTSSEQSDLMDLMPTNPDKYKAAESRFVRGHLLNANLGGLSKPNNLFPITAAANTKHSASIEEFIKDWVNTRKLWLVYKVEVQPAATSLQREPLTPEEPDRTDNHWIDATFKATAAALDTNLKPMAKLTKSISIASLYKAPSTVSIGQYDDFDEASVDSLGELLQKESKFQEVDPLLPFGKEPLNLHNIDSEIVKDTRTAIDKKGEQTVRNQLKQHDRVGDKTVDVLFKACQNEANEIAKTSEKRLLTWVINNWSGLRTFLF